MNNKTHNFSIRLYRTDPAIVNKVDIISGNPLNDGRSCITSNNLFVCFLLLFLSRVSAPFFVLSAAVCQIGSKLYKLVTFKYFFQYCLARRDIANWSFKVPQLSFLFAILPYLAPNLIHVSSASLLPLLQSSCHVTHHKQAPSFGSSAAFLQLS